MPTPERKKSDPIRLMSELRDCHIRIRDEIGKKIVGQRSIVDELIMALLSRGNCLLIGVPGLAKTMLIASLSEVLDLRFCRIQFTPDLMPSDITGSEILEEDRTTGKKVFRFVKGPVFANIVLADEINRTPPKTQAALLQAMQEHEVSAGGTTYRLEEPFFVLATQNPIEQEGTYPLPEAQLDRFMFNLWIDYPSAEEETDIVRFTTGGLEPGLKPVLDGKKIQELQNLVRRVPVSDAVVQYAVDLVRRTRPGSDRSPKYVKDWVSWGAGPRASQYLVLGAKARAALDGRATPDRNDVAAVARQVLRHRVVTNFNAEADGITSLEIIQRLLSDG
ncbi:MoxR family ATPase [bacterium]|nr:MoxR family ATPase [bacterium]